MAHDVASGRAAVELLYQQESGRVFAYCYARIGSRSLAEWAVGATFDRARESGSADLDLDWLLRTADKFCSPRLKLGEDGPARDGALVLRDWNGASFEQIANELDEHRARLEAARQELSPWRRLLGAIGIGPGGAGWLQGALSGAGAVKAIAAATAVAGAVVVVGTPVGDKLHAAVVPAKHSAPAVVVPTAPPRRQVSTPRPAAAQPSSRPAATPVGRPARPPSSTPRPAAQPATSGGAAASPATTTSGVSGGASVTTPTVPRPTTSPRQATTTAPVPVPTTPAKVPTVPTPTVPAPTVTAPPTPTVSVPTASTPQVTVPTVSDPTVTVPPTPVTPQVTVTVTTPKLP